MMYRNRKKRRHYTNRKQCLGLLFTVLSVFLLTACSLATEEGNRISGGDTLIGVFVTTEFVDTFNWDTVDARAIMNGELVSANKGRIYGSYDQEKEQFVFEGLEGYSLGSVIIKENHESNHSVNVIVKGDENSYCHGIASDSFDEVNFDYTGEGFSCSGNLYYDWTQIGSDYQIYKDESYKEDYPDAVVNHITDEDGSEAYEVLRNFMSSFSCLLAVSYPRQ